MPGHLPDLFGQLYGKLRPLAVRSHPIERIVVLKWGENPTYDYYLRPRLRGLHAITIDISQGKAASTVTLEHGDYVLSCRYLNRDWAHKISRATGLAGVGLFFDDDYAAFMGDRSVPLLYRLDVARRTILPLRRIRHHLTDILVSTPVIRDRFRHARATVLRPIPGKEDLLDEPAPLQGGPVRIAFHAQLSHLADHGFAAAIARDLFSAGNVAFDVIGPAQARNLWADIPSVAFQSEMDWPSYRRRTGQIGADILIAPMLDTPLNQARSATKAIDAVRMGAAGVFQASPAYESLGEAALLVTGGPEAWITELRRLIGQKQVRDAHASRLRAEIATWVKRSDGFPELLS
ncbi:MAG: hypothetical protein K2Z25_13820 [Beijerinckiaceae bacterium]|nr:hypothetical protein [Beijerinckiaceae bacterium]